MAESIESPCCHHWPQPSRRSWGRAVASLGFYLDEDAQLIRIFDVVWIRLGTRLMSRCSQTDGDAARWYRRRN